MGPVSSIIVSDKVFPMPGAVFSSLYQEQTRPLFLFPTHCF